LPTTTFVYITDLLMEVRIQASLALSTNSSKNLSFQIAIAVMTKICTARSPA